jgi:hypothetical protein
MIGLLALSCLISMHVMLVDSGNLAAEDSPSVAASEAASTSVSRPAELAGERASDGSHTQAVDLLRAVIEMVVHGPAFDAKVRETVWTTGRSVVGVGTYEQAGGGSGRYNLLVTMHDGDASYRDGPWQNGPPDSISMWRGSVGGKKRGPAVGNRRASFVPIHCAGIPLKTPARSLLLRPG